MIFNPKSPQNINPFKRTIPYNKKDEYEPEDLMDSEENEDIEAEEEEYLDYADDAEDTEEVEEE